MIELKSQYPFIDANGNVREKLIKHYAEDENGVAYKVKQNETGVEYGEAIDLYPCKYTYSTTEMKVEGVRQ